MRQRGILIFLISTLAITFISPSEDPQKMYPVVTKINNGIKTITNPEYPRDGRFTAKLTVEISFGEAGANEVATLNNPFDLKVDDQGLVYVMDLGDGHIKVYDSVGKFVRTIGRKGQGPGEFGMVALFDLMSDGRVCILDMSQHRIMFLTNEGEYLSMFSLDGFYNGVAVDRQDRLYLAKRSVVGELKPSTEFREVPYLTSIFRTDMTAKNLIHVADFRGESEMVKSDNNGSIFGSAGLYVVVWNVNWQGRVYGGYNEDYRFEVYGPDGKVEFSFGRLFNPVKNTRFKGPFARKKNLPLFGQSTHAIVFDEDGDLWLELFQNNEKEGFLYDVFSAEGIYLKQVNVEQRICQFKKGKAYSLVQTEDGYPSVKRFRVELLRENQS